MQRFYDEETESVMRLVYDSFSEKDRRIYAAVEARKLPYGGKSYLSNILGCDIHVITRGLEELKHWIHVPKQRIRREGGGRKRQIEIQVGIDELFLKVLKERTAGDPMNEGIIWTDLTPREISEKMGQEGTKVGIFIVEQLLDKHGYSRKQALKTESVGSSENREEQFENIAQLKRHYQEQENPVVSIDAKKKRN